MTNTEYKFTCPKCGHKFPIQLYDKVSTRKEIISYLEKAQIHTMCPACSEPLEIRFISEGAISPSMILYQYRFEKAEKAFKDAQSQMKQFDDWYINRQK